MALLDAGGARKIRGSGVLLAPAVGPEAHLLLAWLGRLLEWSCTRYALSKVPSPPLGFLAPVLHSPTLLAPSSPP